MTRLIMVNYLAKPNIENDINYKLGHNEKTHVDAESLNDDHTNQNAFDFDKNEEESPKLFSEDTDINNNDQILDESKIEPEIEKDLSNVSFDDKDDLRNPRIFKKAD